MNKSVVYGILAVAAVAGLVLYGLPKYREVTGANIAPPAAAGKPGDKKSARGEGY